jgi:hypothetical protein
MAFDGYRLTTPAYQLIYVILILFWSEKWRL